MEREPDKPSLYKRLMDEAASGNNRTNTVLLLREAASALPPTRHTDPSGGDPVLPFALAEQWKGRADDCGQLARAILAAAPSSTVPNVELDALITKYGFFRQQKRLEEADETLTKIRALLPSAIAPTQDRIDAEEACIDIFKDYVESEIATQTASVRIAWAVGKALCAPTERGDK